MLKKSILGIRIALPFIINYLLFLWIYDINKYNEFAIINTLFYVGMISLIYGLMVLIMASKNSHLYAQNRRSGATNIALAEQNIKNYHDGKSSESSIITVTSAYLKLIYIILGIILFVSAILVYYI